MGDSDLQITVSVDPRGANEGADQAKSAIASLVTQCQALGSGIGRLGKDLSEGLGGIKNLGAALEGLSKGAQAAQSVSGPLKTLSQDLAAVAGKATGGSSGIARFTSEIVGGLSGAVGEGASKLALLGEAASGVGGIAVAVGQAAFAAGQATLEWAQQAQHSATASAQQKERASALVGAWNGLNDAAGKVSEVFNSIGASLASAFAPAVTAAINLASDLADRFAQSYTGGGLLKIAVDLVSGALDGCSRAIAAVIDLLKAVLDAANNFGKLGTDAVESIITIVEDLGARLLNALSPAFKAVQSVATTAWNGIQSAFGALLKAIKIGYDDWKSVNRPLVEAIKGIGAAFGAVQSTVRGIVQTIITWIDKLADAVLRFLEKLPGVSAAFKQIRDDLHRTFSDAQNNLFQVGRDLGGEGQGQAAPTQTPAAPPAHAAGTGGHADPAKPSSSTSPASGSGSTDDCGCDPATASLRETAVTDAAEAGVQARLHAHADANAAIAQCDGDLDAAYARGQSGQAQVAEATDKSKVASNQTANRRITEANDKTLKQFESSVKSLVNTFASGLAKMAEGAETFGKVMRQIGQKILDDVFRVVIGMVEKWAWGETEKVLASAQAQALLSALGLRELAVEIANEQKKTVVVVQSIALQNKAKQLGATQGLAISGQTALKDITNSAAQAASGAYNALANVPFVGPVLGAAAAATVFAAVMAFKTFVASAAGGYDIPAGINPLTQLHAQEMVLPARLANPMRDMLASFGPSGAPAAGGHTVSFGDTHIHGAPNMSPADFRQALAEHRASVAEAVASALHGGWRPSYRQPVGAL